MSNVSLLDVAMSDSLKSASEVMKSEENNTKTKKLKTVSDRVPHLEIEENRPCSSRGSERELLWSHVKAKIDNFPPKFDIQPQYRRFLSYVHTFHNIQKENMKYVAGLFHAPVKVDTRWTCMPKPNKQYFQTRTDFYKRNEFENKIIYHFLTTTSPKVETCAEHAESWRKNRREIIDKAHMPFLLFSPNPEPLIEDPVFKAAEGVKRPRVYLTFEVSGGHKLGELSIELFTDLAPETCHLFMELLSGDGCGYSYVGTRFFTKVPGLYWSGGDVVFNNGFGCYCQKGRSYPIGAENFDYLHTMPGLISMRVTRNNEMCGIFDITFKPLSYFNYRNVVFARVIRPSRTFNKMMRLGRAMSSWPVVSIARTKYQDDQGNRQYGAPNVNFFETKKLRDDCRKYCVHANIPHAKRLIF